MFILHHCLTTWQEAIDIQVECGGANTSSSLSIMIFSRRIIDDVLSLNNHKFNDYIDVIYPKELEIKTLQMLQNGLIILTFIWSLMRMVNCSHDSMTSVMTLISL